MPKNCFECEHRRTKRMFINCTWRTVKSYIGINGQAVTMIECELLGRKLAGDFKNSIPVSCQLNKLK